jgi:hypothetical protein
MNVQGDPCRAAPSAAVARARSGGRLVPSLVIACLVGALLAQAATAAPSARIAGKLQVGETVRVVAKGGPATNIRWQRCPVRVVNNLCRARPVRIARGRTHLIRKPSAGRSLRAVVRIRNRTVVTRWSKPVRRAPAAPPPPGAPAAPVSALQIPPAWKVTGSADTIPFEAGISAAERASRLGLLTQAYAAIDQRVRGGRSLFFFESLGNAELLTNIRIELCSNLSFARRFETSGLGGGDVQNTTGRWEIRLDLTAGVAPSLVLTGTDGSVRDEILDADPGNAARVFLGNRAFTTGTSQVCS